MACIRKTSLHVPDHPVVNRFSDVEVVLLDHHHVPVAMNALVLQRHPFDFHASLVGDAAMDRRTLCHADNCVGAAIHPVALAGILTAIALYSINLRIMDRPNIGLINIATVHTPIEKLGVPSLYGDYCCHLQIRH